MGYQSEAQLEEQFIEQLKNQNYERIIIEDYDALLDNSLKIIKQNNIRNLRLYDCRHTAASIMLKNGVSMKQIQMILGHSDYATTANIYSHLDYADKVSATKEMKNILYGNE